MDVSWWTWLVSFIAIAIVLGAGALLLRTRWAMHRLFTLGWIGAAVFLALAFSVVGGAAGVDEASGILSDYAQESVFVLDTGLAFSVILRRYLPESDRLMAALFGVATTIVIRASFILVVNRIFEFASWLLYFVGCFLVYKGWKFIHRGDDDEEREPGTEEGERTGSWVKRQIRRWERTTVKYGVAHLPPMVLAVVFLTFVDPLAWPDGVSTYPIIMANALALLPIPALVGYSEKIIKLIGHLPYGVGIVAGFIGNSVILSALNDNALPFVNDGQPLDTVPTVGQGLLIFVIVITMSIAIGFSLFRYRKARHKEAAASALVTANGRLMDAGPPRTGLTGRSLRPLDARRCDPPTLVPVQKLSAAGLACPMKAPILRGSAGDVPSSPSGQFHLQQVGPSADAPHDRSPDRWPSFQTGDNGVVGDGR